ncbi:hypothetical protein V6R21_11195 [Limibacter armeniacum]|uniref:tetratricopeptide repeat protein n=1 Tax=Limibacter armeniacum TaxID=466084 RepID=UPI002FE5C6D6
MNKKFPPFIILLWIIALPTLLPAQTFTMSKKCKTKLSAADSALQVKSFQEALTMLEEFRGDCKTRDAKIQGAEHMAEAYNGLEDYQNAIAQADEALKLTKDRSIVAHFQKATALGKMGDAEGAKSSLNKVIELTEKNQNTKERASNYALMAALYDRQLGEQDSAFMYLDQAVSLDPENTDFVIQRGDMYMNAKDYNTAFEAYDKAVSMGRNDLDMYIIRSNARLRIMQDKYGTTKAKELKEKMTPEEKEQVCADITKANELGWNQMDKDMFAALVCK